MDVNSYHSAVYNENTLSDCAFVRVMCKCASEGAGRASYPNALKVSRGNREESD